MNQKWNRKRVLVAGIGILLAILSVLVALLDDDPKTQPDYVGTYQDIQKNVNIIKEEMQEPTPLPYTDGEAPEPVPLPYEGKPDETIIPL